jgi:plasmid maintenance system antidote protein VapI
MEAVENINNYRQWLYQEFSKRKAKNPALSLRAFSSRLNISPAALSQIISGKRKLTKNLRKKFPIN